MLCLTIVKVYLPLIVSIVHLLTDSVYWIISTFEDPVQLFLMPKFRIFPRKRAFASFYFALLFLRVHLFSSPRTPTIPSFKKFIDPHLKDSISAAPLLSPKVQALSGAPGSFFLAHNNRNEGHPFGMSLVAVWCVVGLDAEGRFYPTVHPK